MLDAWPLPPTLSELPVAHAGRQKQSGGYEEDQKTNDSFVIVWKQVQTISNSGFNIQDTKKSCYPAE